MRDRHNDVLPTPPAEPGISTSVVGRQGPLGTYASGLCPLAVPMRDASQVSGFSRSELYRLLRAGRLQAIKSGRTTLIVMDTLREHLASLPPAKFSQSAVGAVSSKRRDRAASARVTKPDGSPAGMVPRTEDRVMTRPSPERPGTEGDET